MATSTKSQKQSATNDVSMNDLNEQVSILKDDIAALTSTLSQYTKGKGEAMVTSAQTKAHEMAAAGAETAADAQKKTEDFIRAQPATALGIAAGAGFLIGMMTARR